MTDNQTPKKEFVQEEIRKKPFNYRRLAERLGIAALAGLVFGAAAGLMFFAVLKITGVNQKNRNDVADNTEFSVTEAETESETEILEPDPAQTEVIIQDAELTLEDYQKLQKELYEVGSRGNSSVVQITSISAKTDMFNHNYQTEAEGSGVVIGKSDEEILILTEKNAIPSSGEMRATFYNNSSAAAHVKGFDPNTGIAVIAVSLAELDGSAAGIAVATIGNSYFVRSGQIAIALGSPLGQCYSVLTGNITSTGSELPGLDNSFSLLTTDIIGNDVGSGVLIDIEGSIIGLIMPEYNNAEQQSILTAVAISDVEPLIQLLMKGEEISYMGVSATTVTAKLSITYDIPIGAYVSEVAMDSPAMQGGIQSGDVITAIKGKTVLNTDDLYRIILENKPGTPVRVTIRRPNGDEYDEVYCQVTLQSME